MAERVFASGLQVILELQGGVINGPEEDARNCEPDMESCHLCK